MLTYRIGTVSPSSQGGMAMAEYLAGEALAPDQAETDRAATAAQYYGRDAPVLSPFETLAEQLGAAVHDGDVAFSDALGELTAADTAAMTREQRASFDDYDGREDRLTKALIEAAERADFTASPESTMPERSAMLRPDISPAVARVLGIDPDVPLTRGQIASLLNGKTATGAEIEGKKRHSAHLSAAEAFGLEPRQPVAGEALRNVLAGRRADGDVVRNAAGKELGPKAIEGLQKRVKLALGLSTKREATQAELDRLVGANEHQDPWTSAKGEVLTKWRDASGRILNLNFYERQITNTHAAVGYIDLTLSAPKGLSIAWARATNEAERAALLGVHTQAVQMTMAYGEKLLGHARLGAGGSRGAEAGNIAWISYNHTTSRPAVDNERVDRHGDAYTERLSLPDAMVPPDMQLHTHSLVPNVVVTPSGRVGSIDLNRLDGVVKELGAAYQGYVARYARDLGAEVMDGVNGEAKLTAITDGEIKLFSKRTEDATRAAEAFAQSRDTDWHTLTPAGRSALVKSAAHEGRKQKEVVPDFKVWNEQAERAGYHHRSVLRPRAIKHELSDDARYEKAYEVSLKRLEAAFDKTATLDAATMRVEAMRGFVVAGISNDPGQDIASVTAMYREHGIRVDGQQTAITMVKDTVKLGRQKWLVTTELQAEMETEVITLARAAAADRSTALSVEQIDRAATEFLARNPKIDPEGKQWVAQREMMIGLATQGRISVGVGAAGAGKSTIMESLVDAWQADGRRVYGTALSWKQTTDLRQAGIAAKDLVALDAFLRRERKGQIVVDSRTVIAVDEVAEIGVKQMRDLLRVQHRTGAQVVMIGDPAQMQAIEAGAVVPLLREAIGGRAVEILTSVRQQTERGLDIATKMRYSATIPDALAMKHEDGDLHIVAGGPAATVKHAAQQYMQQMAKHRDDPSYALTMLTMTNAATLSLGRAVRSELQAAGTVGPDVMTKQALARQGAAFDLALGVGDRVRVFDRLHDADTPGRERVLASNGDVVTVLALSDQSMRVRNDKGDEGTVPWRKLQEHLGAPVRLTLGYARTVNAGQGSTVGENITVALDGTAAVTGFAAYVAETRHKDRSIWIIDESSVRQSIAATQRSTGNYQQIKRPDILRRISDDLSRKPEKMNALDLLRGASRLQHETVRHRQRRSIAMDRAGERHPEQHHHRERLHLHHALRQGLVMARELTQRAWEIAQDHVERLTHRHTRRHGQGLSR